MIAIIDREKLFLKFMPLVSIDTCDLNGTDNYVSNNI